MKDEIKEILEGIKVVIKHDGILEFNAKELKILLDYMTNLQEELKSANESISWWQNRFNAVEKENKQTKLLKERYQLDNECLEKTKEK